MRLVCPCFAAELIGCEAAQALQSASEVVGGDEVVEVPPQLVVAVLMEALNGGVLDYAVHPLDLTVGPRMVDFGEAVVDAVFLGSRAMPASVAGKLMGWPASPSCGDKLAGQPEERELVR